MSTFTCYFCEERLFCRPDGVLRYCKCRMLGIDHTKHYTRFLGTIPVENMGKQQEELYLKTKVQLKNIPSCDKDDNKP